MKAAKHHTRRIQKDFPRIQKVNDEEVRIVLYTLHFLAAMLNDPVLLTALQRNTHKSCSWVFSFLVHLSLTGEYRVTTPTAIESVLPWKRGDDSDEENGAVKQNEFPSWASNKEYLAYSSPSATFLGEFFLCLEFSIKIFS